MQDNLIAIRKLLQKYTDSTPEHAAIFFKTGAGQYAQGDEFIGVTVPNLRKIAKIFIFLPLDDLEILLKSKINEERLLSLIILTQQYKNSDIATKTNIYQFYMNNLNNINNWNLVDSSAHLILGVHIFDKDRSVLTKLAMSKNLWERRISIVSTWYFIRQNNLETTFEIAELLLKDQHDLIHKAVGWMLREAGKRDLHALINFLDQHAPIMPRTMLRYAIEKFQEEQRKNYLLKRSNIKMKLL